MSGFFLCTPLNHTYRERFIYFPKRVRLLILYYYILKHCMYICIHLHMFVLGGPRAEDEVWLYNTYNQDEDEQLVLARLALVLLLLLLLFFLLLLLLEVRWRPIQPHSFRLRSQIPLLDRDKPKHTGKPKERYYILPPFLHVTLYGST